MFNATKTLGTIQNGMRLEKLGSGKVHHIQGDGEDVLTVCWIGDPVDPNTAESDGGGRLDSETGAFFVDITGTGVDTTSCLPFTMDVKDTRTLGGVMNFRVNTLLAGDEIDIGGSKVE
ncbi:hypothetical protein BJV78DRAFT_1150493 [Lactifluus subvellereus]|nr:hypothetical protein BJV78DRAFT_1150493 [Lactifluus subvellereus]